MHFCARHSGVLYCAARHLQKSLRTALHCDAADGETSKQARETLGNAVDVTHDGHLRGRASTRLLRQVAAFQPPVWLLTMRWITATS